MKKTSPYLEGNLVCKTSPISDDTLKPVYNGGGQGYFIQGILYRISKVGTRSSGHSKEGMSLKLATIDRFQLGLEPM